MTVVVVGQLSEFSSKGGPLEQGAVGVSIAFDILLHALTHEKGVRHSKDAFSGHSDCLYTQNICDSNDHNNYNNENNSLLTRVND